MEVRRLRDWKKREVRRPSDYKVRRRLREKNRRPQDCGGG